MHEILLVAGIFLIFAGFVSLIAYVLLNSIQQTKIQGSANASVGGVVMIGPIPIVFGSSPRTVVLAEILAIVLIILAILVFFILGRR